MQDLVPEGEKNDTEWYADRPRSSARPASYAGSYLSFLVGVISMYFGKH